MSTVLAALGIAAATAAVNGLASGLWLHLIRAGRAS